MVSQWHAVELFGGMWQQRTALGKMQMRLSCVYVKKPGCPLERTSQASLALPGGNHEEQYTLLHDT